MHAAQPWVEFARIDDFESGFPSVTHAMRVGLIGTAGIPRPMAISAALCLFPGGVSADSTGFTFLENFFQAI